jgi:hypothetical protein
MWFCERQQYNTHTRMSTFWKRAKLKNLLFYPPSSFLCNSKLMRIKRSFFAENKLLSFAEKSSFHMMIIVGNNSSGIVVMLKK